MASSSSTSPEILLTCSQDGFITAYNPSTGSRMFQLSGSRTPRKGVMLVANHLIAASDYCQTTGNGSIHLYNLCSTTAYCSIPMPEPVAPLAATVDGLYLFAGGISGRIYTVFLSSQSTVINSVRSHSCGISCLEMNADGSLVFSSGDDGTISAYSTHLLVMDPNPAPLQRFHGHESVVTGITPFTGKSSCALISCSLDCTVKFWTLNQAKPLLSITHTCGIWDLKMGPTETEFYLAGSDGCIYRADLCRGKSGVQIIPWGERDGKPWTSIASFHFGRCIASASDDGALGFWENGRLVKSFETGSGISHLVVQKTDALVAGAGDHGGGFHRWESELRKEKVPSELAREAKEMEEELEEAVTDRKRSIGTLEKAVGGYERLLSMINREVRAGGRTDEVKDGAKKKTQKKK